MSGDSAGKLEFRGPVTLATAADLTRRIAAATRHSASLTLDLSAAGPLDSSALAMILSALRRVRKLRVQACPPQLHALAALYGLEELLVAETVAG
ncbi:STAS domain-containing protein [Niveibacterium terrae]|uniref:STAS domain-containing protein n=1 Tax=Niveibacterium terrae TaxID=3373598 RepID=UPI003A8DA66F